MFGISFEPNSFIDARYRYEGKVIVAGVKERNLWRKIKRLRIYNSDVQYKLSTER